MTQSTRMLGVACACGLALAAALQAPVGAQNGATPLLEDFVWRAIGPANMGGRTTDVEGVESNPFTVYIGTASSGVWKTNNGGITWMPTISPPRREKPSSWTWAASCAGPS